MTEHPITPPPDLVEEWFEAAPDYGKWKEHFATQAARWGADQELEAVREYLCSMPCGELMAEEIRAARRPKPPSLKQQALETLKYPKDLWSEAEVDTIRRALEALPDD